MLITSRDTRRWVIPKGWPKKGTSPRHSAAREAFEEAGVVGAVAKRAEKIAHAIAQLIAALSHAITLLTRRVTART